MADRPAIPMTVKAAVACACAAGLIGVGWYLFPSWKVPAVLLLCGIAAALVLLGFAWLRDRRDAADDAETRPPSTPALPARVDQLRAAFDAGLDAFRAAGKDPSGLPWYLLIGGPGAGKTEAIRRCEIGFPPGLQNERQGEGGTAALDWWFTNYGVVLDTAGRMMLDDAGGAAEWRELLDRLADVRPDAPINGILLALPADSLLSDPDDRTDAKAAAIAGRVDVLQRTLGVRVPVYVVVTQCDRIDGFGAFFDALDDAHGRQQLLGWSNPDPVGTPFDPGRVGRQLADIRRQLDRRRLGLLLDRKPTDTDAVYAFPENLAAVGPRLQRYLGRLFTVGEWSPEPLFLRGVYFTSALQHEPAFDADPARPPADAHGRAYFLRDLFVTKVFKEKGLVVRTEHARRAHARHRRAVMTSGFAALLLLAAVTAYGAWAFDRSVAGRARFWSALDKASARSPADTAGPLSLLNIVGTGPAFDYRGGQTIAAADELFGPTIRDVLVQADVKAREPLGVPVAFAWARLGPAAATNRHSEAAYRGFFERTQLLPLVTEVRRKLVAAPPLDGLDPASARRTVAAVEALLRLEGDGAGQKPVAVRTPATAPADAKDGRPSRVRLAPLFRYLLAGDALARFEKDEARLQAVVDRLYPSDAAGWPFRFVNAGTPATVAPIRAGVERLNDYWDGQAGGGRVSVRLARQLEQIADAMASIAADVVNDPAAPADDDRAERWDDRRRRVAQARDRADLLRDRIAADPGRFPDPTNLAAVIEADRVTADAAADAGRTALWHACPPTLRAAVKWIDPKTAGIAVPTSTPADARAEELAVLLEPAGTPAVPRYRLVADAYEAARVEIETLDAARRVPATDPADVAPRIAPPGGTRAAAFAPTRASRLLGPWSAFRQSLAGTPREKAGPFAAQDRAVCGYANAYARHWANVLSADGTPRPPAWSDVAASLPTPEAAAESVRRTAAVVVAALRPLDRAGWPSDTAAVVTETLARAGRVVNGVPAEDVSAVAPLRAWWAETAGKSAAEARRDVIRAGKSETAARVLLGRASGPYQAYWQAVIRSAFSALAQEPAEADDDPADELAQALDTFPLARPTDGAPTLSDAELSAARDALRRLTAAQDDGVPDANGWFDDAYRHVRLARVDGLGGIDRLKRAEAMAALLTDKSLIPCQVFTVDRRTQSTLGLPLAPADTTITFVNGDAPALPLGRPLPAFPRTGQEDSDVCLFLRLDPTVRVRLGDRFAPDLVGPFPCLRALYTNGARPVADNDRKEWLVPLPAVPAGTFVVVRFKFDAAIPLLEP